jgi:hypothetical protein
VYRWSQRATFQYRLSARAEKQQGAPFHRQEGVEEVWVAETKLLWVFLTENVSPEVTLKPACKILCIRRLKCVLSTFNGSMLDN